MQKQHGFSLVELSIVLVILGLLTGGILGGQALIKAAELRAVSSEFSKWQTAVNAFQDKYIALPGDMENATQFWERADTGSTSGDCANPATNTGTGKQTCSGNGNGRLDLEYETYRFWQHLANAGLVNGEFSGVSEGATPIVSEIGENIPASKFGSGGWGVRYFPNSDGMAGFYFKYDFGHFLQIGSEWTGTVAHAPLFTPEEAWNIDTKMDDGQPHKGSVVANPGGPDCVSTGNEEDVTGESNYSLSLSGARCVLHFTKAF